MRKTIAAVTAGLILVAGTAMAAPRSVVDRVGSDNVTEDITVPMSILVIGMALAIVANTTATDDAPVSN